MSGTSTTLVGERLPYLLHNVAKGSAKRDAFVRLSGKMMVPYLVDPNDYFKVICCLVQKRYGQAKDAYADAQAKYQKVDDQIKRIKNQVDDQLKSLDNNAKAAIPSVVDCCGEALPKPGAQAPTAAR